MQTDATDHPPTGPGEPPGGEHFGQGVRQTWELEMLISGAVAFALLQLPSAVDQAFDRMDPHLAGSAADGLFLVHYYAKLALYTLIGTFLVHLVTRAYWVGLIGLEAVFPRGVRWDRVSSGPIGRRLYERRLPSLPALIARTDDVCSMIFSFSFMIVFVFIGSMLWAGLLGGLAFGISRLLFGGERFGDVFRLLALLLWLPMLVYPLIDKAVGGRLDPAGPAARLLRAVAAFYYHATFMGVYGTIMITLFSNVRKKAIYPISVFALAAVLGTFFLSEMTRSRLLSLDSDVYMPRELGPREVSPRYYEDQRPPDEVFPDLPSIQSDVVVDPYVKLFIPYDPRRDNPAIARRCPGARPLREPGLRFERRAAQPRPGAADAPGAADEILRCLAEIHRVSLDGKPLPGLDFHFSTHPRSGVRGILGHIPTAGLARGGHQLQVEAVPRAEPRKGERPPDPHHIWFWI
jgi:hypothetical protein